MPDDSDRLSQLGCGVRDHYDRRRAVVVVVEIQAVGRLRLGDLQASAGARHLLPAASPIPIVKLLQLGRLEAPTVVALDQQDDAA